MTCISNPGEIPKIVQEAIVNSDVIAAALLSGNSNFESRVHSNTIAKYLASPPINTQKMFKHSNFGTSTLGSNSWPEYIRQQHDSSISILT